MAEAHRQLWYLYGQDTSPRTTIEDSRMPSNIATNPVRLAIAVSAFLLIFSVPSLSAASTVKTSRGLPISLPASQEPEDPALAQFVSDGHVLGFGGDGYFVSNGSYALRVGFEGAKPTAPSSDNAGQGRTGTDTKATPLSRVSYSEVWPGIGVTYDVPHGGIARSTWTLAPGADSAAIRLRYNRPVEVSSSGELNVRFETGSIAESRPVAWQDVDGHRHPVEVAFEVLASDLVSFRLGSYRRDLPLVIDPTLSWNTFLGGSSINGYGSGRIAVDDSGNVYVGGRSDATWGNPVRTFTGAGDAFVAKLSPSGGLIWNTFLGGSGDDSGRGLAADGSGNVYVAGYSYATWGSPVRTFTGGENASENTFVAKLSSSGGLIWNTFLGGDGNDREWSIAVDGSGNVYVGGESDATWGSPVRTFTGASDAFVVKLVPSTYVALGDSYSSGEGVPCFFKDSDTPSNACHRSILAYPMRTPYRPHELSCDAASTPTGFLACSGATTKNVKLGGASPTKAPGELSQLDRGFVSDETELVTITIGGNDFGFTDILIACLSPYQSTPDADCNDALDRNSVLLKSALVSVKLEETYQDIKDSIGASTRVFVLGYPRIVSGVECPDVQAADGILTLDANVQKKMREAVDVLNAAMS
ncbi:MAG: SBBP repeat-containing protein [Thioalkalivibrio sp.]|nr:SBBP repeat-containing protein [Thioalkalivibrio sp.]